MAEGAVFEPPKNENFYSYLFSQSFILSDYSKKMVNFVGKKLLFQSYCIGESFCTLNGECALSHFHVAYFLKYSDDYVNL